MDRWSGNLGIAVESVNSGTGIWTETINERFCYGHIIKNNRRLQSNNQLNFEVTISNEISILSDPYFDSNFHLIRYAEFMGKKWKVMSIEVQYPRLILSLGGIYNE